MVHGRHENEEADRDLTIFRVLMECHLFLATFSRSDFALAAIYFNAISAAANEKRFHIFGGTGPALSLA
jgi:hypothetical protein